MAVHPSPGPVVVGVDGSGESERALVFAAESADRLGVVLISLTAGNGSRVEQDNGVEQKLIAAQLAACRARHPGLAIEPHLVEGKPAEALLHAARQAQLVVVGSRGRGGATGALLGSTSRTLLRDSPCAVAVLSPHTPPPLAPQSRVSPGVSAENTLGTEAGNDTRTRSTVVPS